MKKIKYILNYIIQGLKETSQIFISECKNVFRDSGVILIFIIASLGYPLLYNYVYYNETVRDIPVAIVDESSSSDSRRFIQKLQATPEVELIHCANMDEAQDLMVKRDVHGVVVIPNDFSNKLANKDQATVSLYTNMSCFIIYKSVALAVNYVMLDETKSIQIQRYAMNGVVDEKADQLISAVPYNETILYNPGTGFTSFFLPALLIIILHQTLFFGIGMITGTAREEKRLYSQDRSIHGTYRIVFGKASAYLFIYSILAAYILILIPRIFNLPHIGNVFTLMAFFLPFLLATIFFSITVSIFVKNRETGMVMFLFVSILLIFLSGFTWPWQDLPLFWKGLSFIFPSTFGIQGNIKINTMAADISQVRFEYIALWVQTFVYFLTSCFTVRYISREAQ